MSVNDLVDLLAEFYSGLEVVRVNPEREVVSQGYLSIEKAKRELGYEPKFPVEDGLRSCVDWLRG